MSVLLDAEILRANGSSGGPFRFLTACFADRAESCSFVFYLPPAVAELQILLTN
jgi:hypothetical protein